MEHFSSCRRRQDLLRAAIILAPDLSRYLRRRGASADVAQDLMQEVYIRILKIKSLETLEYPKAYLYQVATSVAYEHRVRRLRQPPHMPFDEETVQEGMRGGIAHEANVPESSAVLAERLGALEERLDRLPSRVRNAVLWHHRDGYTCDEIAEKLSAATHRVKKYLVRGLAHCRGTAIEAT
jgi:RNA polymerase sigma-70 factor (ECF subfamily)